MLNSNVHNNPQGSFRLSSQHTPLSREMPNNFTIEAKQHQIQIQMYLTTNQQLGNSSCGGAHVKHEWSRPSGPKPTTEPDWYPHLGSIFTCSPHCSYLLGPHFELLGPTNYLPHLGAEQPQRMHTNSNMPKCFHAPMLTAPKDTFWVR